MRGGGAFVRDGLSGEPRRLRVSAIRELADAQLCFAGFEEWREVGRLDALLELSARCWRTRGYGDFWQYMLVAEGALEIALDPVASLWDLAAPMVVVAGGGRPVHRSRRPWPAPTAATRSPPTACCMTPRWRFVGR